jgi:hypothetical protein
MNATLNLDDDSEAPATTAKRKPFVVEARPMGVRQGIDYSRVGKLLEQIEGPEYR